MWQKAMSNEYHTIINQKTWSLIPSLSDCPVVDCKWLYKLKTHVDGSIARYRARFVIKGFTQTHDAEYFDNFSPVVKTPTMRIVLALAWNHG